MRKLIPMFYACADHYSFGVQSPAIAFAWVTHESTARY
jgi:hypothetical protein